MKKASTVLLPLVLLGLCAAAIQSCASGETDPNATGLTGSGGDDGDGSGGDSGDASGGTTGTSSGGKAGTASGGTTGTATGGKTGSGGTATSGSGGAKTGGSTGTASGGTKTGGSTGTASGGKVGSGGTSTGSGGTVSTSSGGTTGTMSCTKMDSTMTVTNGMATNGTWSGYAYTYVGSTPATITPDCSTSTAACFMTAAKQLCVSGSIGADPSFAASAGFGWDIGAMATSGAAGKGGSTSGSKPAVSPGGSGLAYNVPGITTDMRLQVEDAAKNDYCAKVPTANSGTIPWGMFTEKCYNTTPGTAFTATTKITSVQIVVPATSGSMAFPFCFCVVSLGPAT